MKNAGRYLICLLLLSGCTSVTKEKIFSIKKGMSAYEVKEAIGDPDHFYVSNRWGLSDAKSLYVVNSESCFVHFLDRKVADISCRKKE